MRMFKNLEEIKEKSKRKFWPTDDTELPIEYFIIQWLIEEVEKHETFFNESAKAHRETIEILERRDEDIKEILTAAELWLVTGGMDPYQQQVLAENSLKNALRRLTADYADL